jgi:malate dehydrogenase (oxaloacetate-decarboxylating)(NADP+)
MDPEKARFAQPTSLRTLGEIIDGADVFLGLSAGNVLKPEMVKRMAMRPLVFALANPTPEIQPELAHAARPDVIMATGRSDYPNQVNNVLCFPYIFRGALDVGATSITRSMEIATVHAVADLARQEQSDVAASAYGNAEVKFGPEYLIPKPFDPRLILRIAPAVAKAAMEAGVATRPIADLDAYRLSLERYAYQSGTFMKPIFAAAKAPAERRARIVFAEGEDERVLRAAQVLVDERIARPMLVGRRGVIENRLSRYGLRVKPEADFEIVNPERDDRYDEYWREYRRLMGRRGVSAQYARLEMRRRTTLIAAMLLRMGEADGMVCGTISTPARHLRYIDRVIGKRPDASVYAGMNALLLPGRQIFLADTHVNLDPTPEQIAEIAAMAAAEVRRFGIEPKVALLSHSNFGETDAPSALKMRKALELVRAQNPKLEIDGEMHGDCALDEALRRSALPETTLHGSANLLIFPNLDAGNIAYNLLKTAAGNNLTIGPMLLGCAGPVNLVTPSATVRRLVNMTALTVVQTRSAATTHRA